MSATQNSLCRPANLINKPVAGGNIQKLVIRVEECKGNNFIFKGVSITHIPANQQAKPVSKIWQKSSRPRFFTVRNKKQGEYSLQKP